MPFNKKCLILLFLFTIACKNQTDNPEKTTIDKSEKWKEFTHQKINIPEDKVTLFRIVKIDSLESFYVIYAKMNDNDYKIVSERITVSKGCSKIKKRELFEFRFSFYCSRFIKSFI